MPLALRVLIPMLLLAIAVDFAVLSEGAFRFNTDESMVGVPSGARVQVPRAPEMGLAAPPHRPEATEAVSPRLRRSVAPRLRSNAPAARSHLIAYADSARSSEDH